MKYTKHIFICTNQKAAGKACCGEERGNELVEAFREALKARGINKEVRAQKTGCLDLCAHGPALMVYPEGVAYGKVSVNDVEEIVESHIVNGNVVDRLMLPF